MTIVFSVFIKEMVDSLRDRRAMLSMLLLPLFAPLVVSLSFSRIIETNQPDRIIEVPVKGGEHAPKLIEHLKKNRIDVVDAPSDVVAAVERRDIDLAIVIDPEFQRDFRAGKSAHVTMCIDGTNMEAGSKARRVSALIATYAGPIAVGRLLARGVSPTLTQPIAVQRLDVATPQQRAGRFLNLIPMFVLIAAFMGGMYCATDATAGERERGSLEPLLLTPVSRPQLVAGKWLAAAVLSALTVMLTLGFSLAALGRVPLESIGLRFDLSVLDALVMLLSVLPLCLFTTALQLLVATFARSFKEAQSYLSLMVLVPTVPGMILIFEPLNTEWWMSLVPVMAQQATLNDVVSGEPVSMMSLLVAALACLLAATLCLWATAGLFRREGIIFGR